MNEQIEVAVMSKFVAVAMPKVVKDTLFLREKAFVFDIFLSCRQKKHFCNFLKKNL